MCSRRAYLFACSLILAIGLLPIEKDSAKAINPASGTIAEPTTVESMARVNLIRPAAIAVTPVLAPLGLPRARIDLASLPFGDTSLRLTAPTRPREEPFGKQTLRAPRGALWTKWEKVIADIKAEAPDLARCRADRRRCSPAAARFVDIIDQAAREQGHKRFELVNRQVNAAIAYVSDEDQWHEADRWSAPLDKHKQGAFDTGKGDCEDYAIAKYVALREAGTADADLQVLVVNDASVRDYHAVLAVRVEERWFMLDNRRSRLINSQEATYFSPLFALNGDGVKKFIDSNNSTAELEKARPASPLLRRQAEAEPIRLVLTARDNFAALLTSTPRSNRPAGTT